MNLSHEHMDTEGIELVESLYEKRNDQDACMIQALCRQLKDRLQEVGALRERIGDRKKIFYDGHEIRSKRGSGRTGEVRASEHAKTDPDAGSRPSLPGEH